MVKYMGTMNGSGKTTPTYEARWGFFQALKNMNGSSFFAYCLWPYPEELDFEEADYSSSEEYLQCAGSAGALTVELRVVEDGGGHVHCVVGREPLSGECDVVIPYDEFSVKVYPSEVFTAEQAAPLFDQYLKTTTIPEGYHLRQIDL